MSLTLFSAPPNEIGPRASRLPRPSAV